MWCYHLELFFYFPDNFVLRVPDLDFTGLAIYFHLIEKSPFASKLVNYSRRSEPLNICKNSKSATFSIENDDLLIFKDSLKAHCVSNN